MRLRPRTPRILLPLVGAALAPALIGPAPAQQSRPNLISIVTDDQAHWSIGAYGNRQSRTPNMDRLCREGARFLNAFTATPVCSPSRATFLTGRYGTQVGITDYLTPDEQNRGLGLPESATTWPQVLQRQGYRTALLGKWHLGARPEFHPTRRGFDLFYGFLGGGNTPMNPTLEVEGRETRLTGALPDLLTDRALEFIGENRDRPFALLLHFRAPHLPYGPVPAADSAPFADLDPTIPSFAGLDREQVKRWTRDYYASIHSVDRNLGRLLAQLDELNLARRTVVSFTSDHGYNIGHHGIHTKGNGVWVLGGQTGPKRPNMWDNSVRVPLAIRWPGVIRAGLEIPQMVSNVDTFASMLSLLGVRLPAGARHQGADFSPLLRGEQIAWRDTLFGQYDLHNVGLAYMRMIRTEDWKLVRHYRSSGLDELYDLRSDPGETRNRWSDAALRPVRDDLLTRLVTWQRSIRDPEAPRR